MKVLIHLSHCSSTKPDGWSGAPGEATWVRDLVARMVTACTALGIQVTTVDGDLLDHPAYHQDYDAFFAPHYDANVYGGVGGAFWGRASASLSGLQDDILGSIMWRRFRALPGAPASHFERMNVNVTDYYGFRLTSANTPGILMEHGVGAPGAPDYQWLRDNVQAIADAHAASFAEFYSKPVTIDPAFLVLGPSSPFTPPAGTEEWAAIYRVEAPKAGIRAEIAFAQALHESSNFTFPHDVPASYNNPAGLGATGGAGVGAGFATKTDGVKAHLQHLLWYFSTTEHPATPYCSPLIDTRHTTQINPANGKDFGPHKHYANDIRNLNGHWAVPGDGYGEAIAALAVKIMDVQPSTEDDMTKDETLALIKDYVTNQYGPALEEELRQLKVNTIADAVKAAGQKLSS